MSKSGIVFLFALAVSCAYGQEECDRVMAYSSDVLCFGVVLLIITLFLVMLCVAVMKCRALMLEMREKLEFVNANSDNGKALLGEVEKLKAELEDVRNDLASVPSKIKMPVIEQKTVTADEIAQKITESKSWKEMAARNAGNGDEFARLCGDVQKRCLETYEKCQAVLEKHDAAGQKLGDKLSALNDLLDGVAVKVHKAVGDDIDDARRLYSESRVALEDAAGRIASVGESLAVLKSVAEQSERIKVNLDNARERDAKIAAAVPQVEQGVEDMKAGLAKFREYSESIPTTAKAAASLAEAQAQLKTAEERSAELSGELETVKRQCLALQNDNSKLKLDADKSLATSDELQKRLDESNEVRARLEAEKTNVTIQLDGITQQYENLDVKCKKIDSENVLLKEQQAKLERELSVATEQAKANAEELEKIRPGYQEMLAEKSAMYPSGLQDGSYADEMRELSDMARCGSVQAELCLRDLAMANTLMRQTDALSRDALEQLMRALWYFSRNFTAAMKGNGLSAAESCRRLNAWMTYFLERKDERFALQMPEIGDAVVLSWMTPSVPGANTVSAVESWAVYSGDSGTPTHKAFVR